MTNEELHEENLAIARSLIEKDPSLTDWVLTKFPELAESDDEKIRKEIINYFSNKVSTSDETELLFFKRWITWLEKQGEQKPPKEEKVWTIYDAKDGDVLNSARVQATIIFKGFADDGKHILAHCALQKGFFLPQELLWDRDFEPASEYWKNALYDAMRAKGYEWDADNLELNKIVKWSEEDDMLLTKTVRFLNNEIKWLNDEHKRKVKNCVNWLISLDPQQHWKPSVKTAVKIIIMSAY